MNFPTLRNRRGSTNVEDMAIVILVFAVTAIIAVLTFFSIYAAMPKWAVIPGSSAIANTTNATIVAFSTNFYSSVQLLGVTLIVMAAVSVIGVIMWLRNR
jgi:hypothetical protein